MAGEETKKFLGLLNGLAKRIYYGESDITDDFLKAELYPNLSEEEFRLQTAKCQRLIKTMASSDMDFDKLEAFLISQTKKRDGAITEEEAKVFSKFWRNHKTKIHDTLIAATSWNNSLKSVNWRIDVKSQSKNIDQLNIPTAIMEFQVTEGLDKAKEPEVVLFEMDEEKLTNVLSNMQEIEKQINAYCNQ
ncbi:COMM domain-containing protein 1-like [Lineus longissimus]|uniref:COMM domain-containing protein 1-like n=1 Tax=Lineus longissimus TaxID=88925 RepID=UPI002B4D2980